MPVLPVPLCIALLLFGFLLQRLVRGETHVSLLALIAVCAVQATIVTLVQYYGFPVLRPVQAIMAICIPPIAWFAFARAAGNHNAPRIAALHLAGPLLALILLASNPLWLDALIPLSFASYGTAMLVRLRAGEDSLPHSRLESGGNAVAAWRVLALALIASAGSDIVISYGLSHGHTGLLGWVPSLVSSLSLLALGALSLSNAIEARREGTGDEEAPSLEDQQRDLAIVARLDDYVAAHKPYLDPDLTLARLARKIVIPAKQVSAAINRVKGENVSRYINRLRIDEACTMLAGGKSVTASMLDAGFNTKSNFNREFLRVKGKSPSQWLADYEA